MPGMIVGYARTSTVEQHAGMDAQVRDLQSAGCERIFHEQVSSTADRAQLKTALDFVREGDALVVTKPDRLARSTMELLKIEGDLSKRGVGLKVLSMGGQVLDTRNPTSKMTLTVLAAVATWEREIMLERQREGIEAAKVAGKYKGRAPTARRKAEQVRALWAERVGATDIAKRLCISRTSVYRLIEGFDARDAAVPALERLFGARPRPHRARA